MRYEIRIAGSGGQGVILAGLVIAEAGLLKKFRVSQYENYGPETRGGISVSDVIFSDTEIDYPIALGIDILVALNQKASNENMPSIKPDGLIIADSDLVDKILWGKVVRAPFSRMARQNFDNQKVTNVLALGALVPFCSWLSYSSLEKAIKRRIHPDMIQLNLQALQEGLNLANSLKKKLKFHDIEGATEV
jgi:2-oxoglutarate ferredoxin oxidoreductase subunit gamma